MAPDYLTQNLVSAHIKNLFVLLIAQNYFIHFLVLLVGTYMNITHKRKKMLPDLESRLSYFPSFRVFISSDTNEVGIASNYRN